VHFALQLLCPSFFSIRKLYKRFLLKSIPKTTINPETQLIPSSASSTNSPRSLKTSKASGNLFGEEAKTNVFVSKSQQNQVRWREVI